MKFASSYIISLLYLLVCCGPAQPDVSLTVSPDRCQFFKHETISLSCEEERNSVLEWFVKRHTSGKGNGTCNYEWGVTEGASCTITLYRLDSGLYWCESKSGELSRTINIMISDADVILESPVLPVTGGSDVTLRCLSKDKTTGNPSFDLPADFYQNGSLFRTESTGQMTIHSVYKSDEGFYKCNISDHGQSPESWMEVNVSSSIPRPSTSTSTSTSTSSPSSPTSSPTSAAPPLMSLTGLIMKLVALTPYVVSTFIYIAIVRARAAAAANARNRRDDDYVIMEVAV